MEANTSKRGTQNLEEISIGFSPASSLLQKQKSLHNKIWAGFFLVFNLKF